MALVFHRRLAIPLWAIVFIIVALMAPAPATPFLIPPITLFVIAAVGIAAMLFSMTGPFPWLRTSPAVVCIPASGRPGRRLENGPRQVPRPESRLSATHGESGMNRARPLVIAVGLILAGQIASAQEQVASAPDMSRYRAYVLESTLDTVVVTSGARAADAKTLHERPAAIQQLEWRAPYVDYRNTQADPVREISFTFFNDALYQVVVNYDRDRTEGLTNSDMVESLSAVYGVPTIASAKARTSRPPEAFPDSTVLARWENPQSLLTLIRGSYAPEFQLILISKPLNARARTAVREALRLDAIEAPRREAEQRKKEAGDASAARDKTRDANKAAFRP